MVLCAIYGQNQINFTRIKNFKPYIIPGVFRYEITSLATAANIKNKIVTMVLLLCT